MIVRFLDEGGFVLPHLYYRSDQFIATTRFNLLPGYSGSIEQLPGNIRKHFLPSRFEVADDAIVLAKAGVKVGATFRLKEYVS